MNTVAWVEGNPVVFVDPSGLDNVRPIREIEIGVIIGGAAAAMAAQLVADELYEAVESVVDAAGGAGESTWNFISGNVSSLLGGNETPPGGSDEAAAIALELTQDQIQDAILDGAEDFAAWCNSTACGPSLRWILEELGIYDLVRNIVFANTLKYHDNVKLDIDEDTQECIGSCPSGGFDHCRIDRVDPPGKSRREWPHPGDHVHIYYAEYDLNSDTCMCYATYQKNVVPLPPGGDAPNPPCTPDRTIENWGPS